MKTDRKNYFIDVGQYYDKHKEDLNLILGEKDKIVHHHSGICAPGSLRSSIQENGCPFPVS